MAFFDNMDEKISNLINTGAGKAKDVSESFRISGLIKDEEKKQEELYRQIGKYYYENCYDTATGKLKVWCVDIKSSIVQIMQYQEQLNKLKGAVTCPGCGAQVPDGAGFCSACGMKMQPQNNGNVVQTGRRCPSCGNIVDQEAMFCTTCGQKMPEQPEEVKAENSTETGEKQNVCPSCGAVLKSDQLFCTVCGKRIPEQIGISEKKETCPMCGADVEEDQLFCTNCGAAIEHKPAEIPEKEEIFIPENVEEVSVNLEDEKEREAEVQAEPEEEEEKQGICPECGRILKPGQRFCTSCGTKVGE